MPTATLTGTGTPGPPIGGAVDSLGRFIYTRLVAQLESKSKPPGPKVIPEEDIEFPPDVDMPNATSTPRVDVPPMWNRDP